MEVSINMSSTLDKLTKLANAGNINQDPYENEKHDIKSSDNSSKKFEKMLSKKARKEESFLSRLNRKLEDYGYLSGDDFDDILDSIDIDDEDIELKNNLISMAGDMPDQMLSPKKKVKLIKLLLRRNKSSKIFILKYQKMLSR